MALQPPTSRLPPIHKIASYPARDLSEALAYLRHIYSPEVRGSRRYRPDATLRNASTLPSMVNDPSGLDDLRSDAFERSYAMRWLTALVSQAEIWEVDPATDDPVHSMTSLETAQLIQDAASLLAICSGTAAAGIVVRDFVFERSEGEDMLKVHIRDVPLDNKDYGSVGAQTWGGACVLAETIVEDPTRFGLLCNNREMRILELGAGTGLVSLAVGKLLQDTATPSHGATIIATDYYPSVLENLATNIRSNFPSFHDSQAVRVSSHFLDWSLFANEPNQSPPFDLPFDLVLGADVVYEAQHAIWIKSCLTKLLKKPTKTSDPLFHLMIPLRSTHSSESSTVDTLFSGPVANDSSPHKDLRIISKEVILCDAGNNAGPDQIEYAYYKIGWR
ncbi:putative methyltransferase-domain-containing protein [Lyophyllum atratum]|nr:putative methyltransferase-domain-containing protein [Lyophyllum atratum]